MNFLIEDPEGGFQKITEEIMKKYNYILLTRNLSIPRPATTTAK